MLRHRRRAVSTSVRERQLEMMIGQIVRQESIKRPERVFENTADRDAQFVIQAVLASLFINRGEHYSIITNCRCSFFTFYLLLGSDSRVRVQNCRKWFCCCCCSVAKTHDIAKSHFALLFSGAGTGLDSVFSEPVFILNCYSPRSY